MDWDSIIVATIAGAVGGGLGGLLGLTLSRFFGKSAQMFIMPVCVVLGLFAGRMATDAFKDNKIRQGVVSEVSGNELMTLIKEKYPDDFRVYVNKLNTRTNKEQATAHGRELGETIRRREADKVWTANDRYLISYIASMRGLTEQIRDDAGEEGCYEFIARGELPTKSTERIGAKANTVGVAMMRMLSEGRDEPVERRERPSPQDVQLLVETLQAGGMTETEIEFIKAAPQTFEPGVCEAFLSFYRGIETADGEFAQRFRSSFVYNLAAA